MNHSRPMTFKEATDGWIFGTHRVKRIMWERSRAVATTEAHRETLRRLFEAYLVDLKIARDQMEDEGRDVTNQNIVLQRAAESYYAGPLIHGRFQVMESAIPRGTYYLADHMMPDLVHRSSRGGRDGEILRFPAREEAEAFAALAAGVSINPSATPGRAPAPRAQQETKTMAKEAKKAVAGTAAEKTKEAKVRAPSASSRFKELIVANATIKKPLTDDEIFAKVQAEFGLDESKRSYVNWYRNDMQKKGLNPPEPVGGAKPKMSPSEKGAALKAARDAKAAGNVKSAAPPANKAGKPAGKGEALTRATTKAVEAARTAELVARGRKPGRDKAA